MSNLGVGVTVSVIVDGRRVPVLVRRDGDTFSTKTLFTSDAPLESSLTWAVVSGYADDAALERIRSLPR